MGSSSNAIPRALRLALAAGALLCAFLVLWNTRPSLPRNSAKEILPEHGDSQTVPPLEDKRQALQPATAEVERQSSRLQALSLFQRNPIKGLSLIASAGGEELHLLTDSTGNTPIPTGSWDLRTPDADHVLLSTAACILPEEVSLVWISRRTTLTVQVRSLDGAAVPRAVVDWQPRRATFSAANPIHLETDPSGIAYLKDWVERPGLLTAHADGMDLAEVYIQGPLREPRICLYLRPSADEHSLCVTDFRGVPLPGVNVSSRLGELGLSGEDGRVDLPSWIPIDEELFLKRSGHIEARAFAGQEECVALPTAATLRVVVEDAEPPARISIFPVENQEHLSLSSLHIMNGNSEDFPVPEGMPLKVEVFDSIGLQGRAEVEGLFGLGEIRIVLSESGVSIDCQSAEGAQLPGSVEVNYQETGVPIRTSSSGVTWLPFPEKASSVRLSSGGYESVSLRPVGSNAAQPGTIRVQLTPAVEHTLRLLSGDDQPARGMRIAAWPRSTGIKQHPDLNGGWPTNHPGWCLHRGMAYRGISDSSGTWTAQLPLGEYRVSVDVPDDYGTDESPSSLYLGQTKIIALTGATETTLRIALPVFLSLDVFEETTMLPVPEVQVGGSVIPELPRRGNHWEGWIPDDTREITVVAPGIGSARLWLPLNDTIVKVSPDEPGTIVVSNWPADAPHSTVWVDLYERWGLNRIGSGKTQITLDARGTARLFIPYIEVQEFGLDLPGYEFTPDIQAWEPGGTFTFEIREAR